MKRLLFITICTLSCILCGPLTHKAAAQTYASDLHHSTHEERAERRAERLAEYAKQIDSIVLSHNFEFNPQSVQLQPAGPLNLLSNANYTVFVWRGSLDICLPYYTGIVPPYRYVLLNTGTPNISDYITTQTDYGWTVSFKTTLYATDEYTFLFEIYSHGGANLTITNTWYNPVQYMGTISQIY